MWCETWVPFRRHIRLLECFHIRRLQLILGIRWWHKVTHSEIRSRTGIPSIESMLLHRQLRWLGHVIRMPDGRLPHRVPYGQLPTAGVLMDKRNASRITSSRSLKSATFHFTGWRLSHPTELPGDLPVPLECHALTLNTIEQQLSDAVADTSLLHCSAKFRILFIDAYL